MLRESFTQAERSAMADMILLPDLNRVVLEELTTGLRLNGKDVDQVSNSIYIYIYIIFLLC